MMTLRYIQVKNSYMEEIILNNKYAYAEGM